MLPSGVHESTPLKTTIWPRWTCPTLYDSRLTMTRSPFMQGVLHRPRRDEERLEQEAVDADGDGGRDHQQDDSLDPERSSWFRVVRGLDALRGQRLRRVSIGSQSNCAGRRSVPRVSSTPEMSAAATSPLTDLGGFGAFGVLGVLPDFGLRCAPGGRVAPLFRQVDIGARPHGCRWSNRRRRGGEVDTDRLVDHGIRRDVVRSPASRDVSAPGWCRASRGSWPSCPEVRAGSTASPDGRRRESRPRSCRAPGCAPGRCAPLRHRS